MTTSPEAVFLRLPYLTIYDSPSRREKLPILTLPLAETILANPARKAFAWALVTEPDENGRHSHPDARSASRRRWSAPRGPAGLRSWLAPQCRVPDASPRER